MKEASGEVSMTLIVIVAAAAILAIFMLFRKPIFDMINGMWSGFGQQAKDAKDWTPGGGYIQIPGHFIDLGE